MRLTRARFDRAARALGGLSFASEITIVGSSAFFALESSIPPNTADVDIAVPQPFVEREAARIADELTRAGLHRAGGSATWLVRPAGPSVDLLAYDADRPSDRIGGAPGLPAMIFGDLSRILVVPGARRALPSGLHTLSPAALCASKLAMLRMEKGPRDKVQALLLIGENRGDAAFREALPRFLRVLPADVREEIVPECQAVFASMAGQTPAGPDELEGYGAFLAELEQGFRDLASWEREFPP